MHENVVGGWRKR